jgi:hypothetical protein
MHDALLLVQNVRLLWGEKSADYNGSPDSYSLRGFSARKERVKMQKFNAGELLIPLLPIQFQPHLLLPVGTQDPFWAQR